MASNRTPSGRRGQSLTRSQVLSGGSQALCRQPWCWEVPYCTSMQLLGVGPVNAVRLRYPALDIDIRSMVEDYSYRVLSYV